MLRMDEINKIRKSFYTNGENKHQIAKKFNRAWDTVNRIIEIVVLPVKQAKSKRVASPPTGQDFISSGLGDKAPLRLAMLGH